MTYAQQQQYDERLEIERQIRMYTALMASAVKYGADEEALRGMGKHIMGLKVKRYELMADYEKSETARLREEGRIILEEFRQ